MQDLLEATPGVGQEAPTATADDVAAVDAAMKGICPAFQAFVHAAIRRRAAELRPAQCRNQNAFFLDAYACLIRFVPFAVTEVVPHPSGVFTAQVCCCKRGCRNQNAVVLDAYACLIRSVPFAVRRATLAPLMFSSR